ncbi:MAG TPA: hypothetical protein VKH46_06405 [Thermoanaerobaculia bacterium]|nr:hypothetical protein [Thermoanaerobaculia bacterium]
MRILRIAPLFFVAIVLSSGAARAQASVFGVGASGGLVDSAERNFRFSEFDRSDVNLWLQYAVEEQVVLRGTVGRMNVAAHNAGQSVGSGDTAVVGPEDLRDRIDYGLLSTSYDFVESAWTSGLFGGVGIYRIRPGVPAGDLAVAADKDETVWGLHAGVDAQLTVWRTLAVVGRITAHFPQTKPHRTLITADAGLSYRF